MLKFAYASRASQGARSYQEDAAAVWPGPDAVAPSTPPPAGTGLVAVLADGMGGHAAGDVASTTVCSMFLRAMAGAQGGVDERLSRGLNEANQAVRAAVEANRGLDGMGATVVAVHFGVAGAEWISVGDSPLYLHRGDDMIRLNQDHSLAPLLDQMVADGKMSLEEARNDPRRHYLRSAVTGDDLDLIDASDGPLALETGDLVLLASDGLLTLEDDEIRRVITAYRGDGVEAIADALLRAVHAAGDPHQDNTTVIVVAAS